MIRKLKFLIAPFCVLPVVLMAACDGGRSSTQPTAVSIDVSPTGMGLESGTVFTFSAAGGASGTSYDWNLGDGTVVSRAATVSHVYTTSGTFTVQIRPVGVLTAVNPAASTVVTVGSLAGTWDVTLVPSPEYPSLYCTKFTAVLTQSGDQIRGRIMPVLCAVDRNPTVSPDVLLTTYSAPIISGEVSHARQARFGNEQPLYDATDDVYWTAEVSADLNAMGGPCTQNVCSSMNARRR